MDQEPASPRDWVDDGRDGTRRDGRFAVSGGGEIGFARKPVREPVRGQLLIGVRANALCGSERGQYFDGSGVTPGHRALELAHAAIESVETGRRVATA